MGLFWGLLGYLGLLATLTAVTHAAAVGTARVLGLPRFRWFESGLGAGARWRRALVRVASVLAPFATCTALFWLGLMIGGERAPTTTVVVLSGPAKDAGMLDGDRIVSVDGVPATSWQVVLDAAKRPAAERVVVVERKGVSLALRVVPRSDGRMGVAPRDETRPLAALSALRQAAAMPFLVLDSALRSAFDDRKVDVRGPVEIVQETGAAERHPGAFWGFLGALGAYLLPGIVGFQLFEMLSLAVFLETHSSLARAHDRSADDWRLARLRQALLLSVASMAVFWPLSWVAEAVLANRWAVPIFLLVTPATIAIYPLVWMSAAFFGRGWRTLAIAGALVLPCLMPLAALGLIVLLGRELARRGFQVGLLAVMAPPEPTLAP